MKRAIRVVLVVALALGSYLFAEWTGLLTGLLGFAVGYVACWFPRDIGGAMGD